MAHRPIQIVSFANHKLILQDLNNVRKIFEADKLKDRDLVVVSISGALRQGKSFLLNFFLKYLNARVCRIRFTILNYVLNALKPNSVNIPFCFAVQAT